MKQAGPMYPRFEGSYLVLELTNRCPAACRHCIQSQRQGHEHYRRDSDISAGTVRSIARDSLESGLYFDTLILFWLGEPLMHPEFAEIYSMLLESNKTDRRWFGKIEVHTNAIPMTREHVDAAVSNQSVPARWHLSLDAVARETYESIKGVDAFDLADANALSLLDARGQRKWPALVFQMVVQKENAGEARAFVQRWKQRIESRGRRFSLAAYGITDSWHDRVFLRQLDTLEPLEQPDADVLYRSVCADLGVPLPGRAVSRVKERRVCSGPWKSPTIGADSRVTVCTRDSAFSLEVGRLAPETGLARIWWEGEEISALRKAHADGWALPELCRGCPIPMSSNYTSINGGELARYRAWLKWRTRWSR